jgi:hypothetical protein
MKLNASNLFQFITYITPFLLAFTFILIGFINNQPVNSLIYVGAVCFATFLVSLTQSSFNVEALVDRSPMCDLWELPFVGNNFINPSLSTFFIMFSAIYMLYPMFMSGSINYGILILFISLFCADVASKLYNKCTNITGVVMATIFASVIGFVSTMLMYSTNPELLFFSSKSSNNVYCSKPANNKQKFKCAIYKNGELFKNL